MNRQIGVGDSKYVIVFDPLLTRHVIWRMRSGTHTHTQPFNGPFSRTTRVSRYQKGKTNLDFTEARDGKWQWNQLGHMQVCTLLQTNNHTSTQPLCFLRTGCPSCRPTNSVKTLKAACSGSVHIFNGNQWETLSVITQARIGVGASNLVRIIHVGVDTCGILSRPVGQTNRK